MSEDITILDELGADICTITNSISPDKIGDYVAGVYMEKWKTSYDYKKTVPIHFENKLIDTKVINHPEFLSAALYVEFLITNMLNFEFKNIEEWARKEIREWDKRGGLCLYVSVVQWCLLYESTIIPEEKLKYIQGFYSHPSHGVLSIFENTATQSGLHAFLTIDDAVVDFSIKQEECCFNFEEGAFILGKIPKNMNLSGWPEGKNVVKQYAREMAKFSGLTYYEWIEKHRSYAFKIAMEELNEGLKELKTKGR
jgi:hypothetical protein